MKRRILRWILALICALLLLLCAGIWSASSQILFPVRAGVSKEFAVCGAMTAQYFGAGCGNLRTTHEFKFSEVQIPSVNGYDLPGWLISTDQNGFGPFQGAIMLVHSGGSDRREDTRYIRFFLKRRLDVLTFDLSCHGEAPCPVPGLTYGQRESRDVFSAYLNLTRRYKDVYAMGSSAGAAAILIALPEMPRLRAVIAENPVFSFQRLMMETPAAPPAIPAWFKRAMIRVTMLRSGVDGLLNSGNSLRLVNTIPIYFIQSTEDRVNPYQHTQELVAMYSGPKKVWFPDKGDHAAIWDVDHAAYEGRLGDFLDSVQ